MTTPHGFISGQPHLDLLLVLQQRSLHDVAELEDLGLNLEGMPGDLDGQQGSEPLTMES